ncbi:SDR family NAD(P)-dependent oxidoreductase [Symbioplanes lichenis]|uniref:SDR family NAD(P)-dependent oxidoreductase n=1 Tax=Symbioplanes lichenis TaxID=1629072 RepID=UPI0027399D60|nr:SDR family NAD(P)-dependent oxidoreductase [Actinoplanes lichenis]
MVDSLSGRRALVTGASGGIGAAVAEALARAGADLVLSYSAHREDALRAAATAGRMGRIATVLQADLSGPEAGRDLLQRAAESGPVDLLVANAGVGIAQDWDEVDDDLWAHTLAVNTTAPWQMAQAALPGMIERGYGRILFVSSVAALTGGVVGPHYAASKAALHGLLHHLAPRVAPHGVTVNALAPALVAGTRMLPAAEKKGDPADIAAMAVAMLTNPYLTNKVVTLDGGLHPV